MRLSFLRPRPIALLIVCALAISACGGATGTSPAGSSTPTNPSATPNTSTEPSGSAPSVAPSNPSASQAPDTGGGTSHGDIPDNAVFLTYRGGTPPFSVQYVEGWQVSQQPTGVVIRDKDSRETVSIVALPPDVAGFVTSSDLPSLRTLPGFKLERQDTVKLGATSYVHLLYHALADPDPVTGKQVPSTIDRYYVPGASSLAIVSLSTPDGVDNVDAFRQMIASFKWS